MSVAVAAGDVPVFCHECSLEVNARLNAEIDEYQCNTCNSTFVEQLQQGLDEFQARVSSSSSSSSALSNISVRNTYASEGALLVDSEDEAHYEDDDDDDNSMPDLSPYPPEPIPTPSQSPPPEPIPTPSQSPPPSSIRMGGNEDILQLFELIAGVTSAGGLSGMVPGGIVPLPGQNAVLIRSVGGVGLLGPGGLGLGPGGAARDPLMSLLASISGLNAGIGGAGAENIQLEQFLHHILMNESSHQGPPPASETLLAELLASSSVIVRDDAQIRQLGECAITQELFEMGDTVVCLPCTHNFKKDAIVQWLKMNGTCPTCRVVVGEPRHLD